MSSNPTVQTPPKNAQNVYQVIAGKVRADSREGKRLTHVEELGPLFPEMTPEEIVNYLTELYEIDAYKDVRATMAPSGAVSLYSADCFSPDEAAARCMSDQVHAQVAARVREDSTLVRLTPVSALSELFPNVSNEQMTQYVASLCGQAEYADITLQTGPGGTRYLYSENAMTGAFASLLTRAEAKDPCKMIAETVREESRTYPRPTKVTLFYEPVFQIDGVHMQEVVDETLSRPDCADIKKIVASTGAVYLYSERYMPSGQAERWVEWEEVEQFRNP